MTNAQKRAHARNGTTPAPAVKCNDPMAVVIMPLHDTALYGNGTAVDYMLKYAIKNAMFAGDVWNSVYGICKVNIFITRNITEEIATETLRLWWNMDDNKSFRKLGMWFPLNDIQQTIKCGSSEGDGEIAGELLHMLGFNRLFADVLLAEMPKDEGFALAMKNSGIDKILATWLRTVADIA